MPSDTTLHETDQKDQDRLDKNKKQTASSKTKDLSHVPCKFFKVGGCTAGSSCPFSHSSAEPGSQKEACTWFVKGNCKFGHKCALAHILPGQSMAMDRKNKKAAQAAANAGGGGNSGGNAGGSGSGTEKSKSKGGRRDGHSSSARLPLLAGGSTAPTRILGSNSSSRPPMGVPLKAAISPSAPAPTLNDNDFTSFSIDELDHSPKHHDDTATSSTDDLNTSDSTPTATTTEPTNTLPTRSSAASSNNPTSPTPDFGPIGSPPNYRNPVSPTSTSTRAPNGTNTTTQPTTAELSTSPRAHPHPSHLTLSSGQYRNGLPSSPPTNPNPTTAPAISSSLSNTAIDFLSTSPFSAPGNQSVFRTGNYSPMPNVGVPASLGALPLLGGRGGGGVKAGNTWGEKGEYDISIEYDEFTGTTTTAGGAGGRSGLAMRRPGGGMRDEGSAVDDEDLDLLPGSLSDLLTDEERSRRMSRSGGVGALRELREGMGMMGINSNATAQQEANAGGAGGGMMGHRYSRSVPAPTLLSDIKSIWADSSSGLAASPARTGLATGAPNTTTSSGVFGSPFAATPDDALSSAGLAGSLGAGGFGGTPSSVGMMSLSPSNASAAFLPGLHRHYSNAKAKAAAAQQLGLGVGGGGGSGGLSRQMRGASGPSLLSVNAASSASNASGGGGH
ncbi:hypothetical protein CVT24_008038, partial [Panaeolus cyanescens]